MARAVRQPAKLDFDRDGAITTHDLDIAVGVMESDKNLPVAVPVRGLVQKVVSADTSATLVFRDGSTLGVPRTFSGQVLDMEPTGSIARAIMRSRRSFRSVDLSAAEVPAIASHTECFLNRRRHQPGVLSRPAPVAGPLYTTGVR